MYTLAGILTFSRTDSQLRDSGGFSPHFPYQKVFGYTIVGSETTSN